MHHRCLRGAWIFLLPVGRPNVTNHAARGNETGGRGVYKYTYRTERAAFRPHSDQRRVDVWASGIRRML